MRVLLLILVLLASVTVSGCLGGSAAASNGGARANLNLGTAF